MLSFLNNFFQLTPIPSYQLTGTYDLRLVLLSFLVATFASYIALDITGRLRDIGRTSTSIALWLTGGAIAMGAGIWSMHFIGMLAFSMPGMPITYDPYWTGLSMVVAILASGFALILLKELKINWKRLALGGIILGFAIASMHYTGMAAMQQIVEIHYLPSLFALSILVAIFASEAALWLALKSNQVVASVRFRLKLISASVMGAAICGMHYTGMSAAVFTAYTICFVNPHTIMLNPQKLAITIASVTFVILGIAVIVSSYKEAQNQLMLAKARQAGMSEVASSVLHNVGNILNSLNITTLVIVENLTQSKLSNLEDLNALLQKNKHDLVSFLSQKEVSKDILEYINRLNDYWKNEQALLLSETQILLKNIEHIKNAVAMQQNLSKTRFEQITSINSVLDESLFICGLSNGNKKITIEKKYGSIKPITVDKVKLIQIFINLLRNAKEAVMHTTNSDKHIIVKTYIQNNKVFIQVEDNGIGIASSKLTKIFAYGYTTKESGHGFGLHSSAIAAKEMGGSLKVESGGEGKGATFTLELPYNTPA